MVEVESGVTYRLTNAKAGTVIDLSGVDNLSIIGYPYHNGTNQQWTMNWLGKGWSFKSVSSGLYLGINGTPGDGTFLQGVSTPFTWHIWHDASNPNTFRIFVPNTHVNIDLANHGDPTPGTPIQLWWTWNGTNQAWAFDKGSFRDIV